jgi:hypothetical protein
MEILDGSPLRRWLRRHPEMDIVEVTYQCSTENPEVITD